MTTRLLVICLLFPLLLYGKDDLKDTVDIRVGRQMYELTTSVDSVVNESGGRPSAVRVRLCKKGQVVGERIFPLSGTCPIEEDISIESTDNGFSIRLPYCGGYLFYIGTARFTYSAEHGDFILTEYTEEITDRQHPEADSRTVRYDLCAQKPVVWSAFSPDKIKGGNNS